MLSKLANSVKVYKSSTSLKLLITLILLGIYTKFTKATKVYRLYISSKVISN